MFTKPKNIVSEKEHGFTLVELIIVIIIVGILAAMGITQYSKLVEKSRRAEARIILGQMLKLATAYQLENGVIGGVTNGDLNLGTSADQIPTSCRSTHYFKYGWWIGYPEPYIGLNATRCTSGGKSPQGSEAYSLWWNVQVGTGITSWETTEGGTWNKVPSW